MTASTEPGRKVRPNTQFARVNTASFQGERGDATLRTTSDLTIKPGVQLAEGCFIGKQLGKGIQVSQMLSPVVITVMLAPGHHRTRKQHQTSAKLPTTSS